MTSLTLTAFQRQRQIARGSLSELLSTLRSMQTGDEPIFIFDDRNGKRLDIHAHGDEASAIAAYPELAERQNAETTVVKPRGRPKLGVSAKEVTLLPRHWEWLATQPGGASATLRRLIEQAKKAAEPADNKRRRHESAYQFMHELAGNLPEYETALRALFADDETAFSAATEGWPQDIHRYAAQLAFGNQEPKND
ncbi:Uncharacterized protein conserved in bacteria [Cedecea lapagei]|uniref:Uncharacterized protein conserved in bacteria n=1 Tax=Cedecea lapagei TaxID=158823 RepID=A0A447V5L2_9ENTR|nr:DUF2239 family protein [Cedecea lapagei]VEB99727.1 Uncharacterized protein conserved in bacteria [Cedecea lapagei]